MQVTCRMLALAGLSVSLGCRSDVTVDLSAQSGNYVLRTVNGVSLPIVVETAGTLTRSIVSDTLSLAGNGTFFDVVHLQANNAGTITSETSTDSGTWSVSGSVVTIYTAEGVNVPATLNGSTLTITQTKAVYTR